MWRTIALAALLALTTTWATGDLENPVPALMAVSSLTQVAAGLTLYMNPSTGVDATEARVAIPLPSRTTFRGMACTTSGATGSGNNIAVSGRAGPCGALVDVPGFACTITGGASPGVCNQGAILLTISAGQCWALKIVTPAVLTSPVWINCSIERSG